MSIIFKTTERLIARVRRDLLREHAFAHERVGFITTGATDAAESLVLFASDYLPVADDDYVDDPSVGAMIGQEAFRKILEVALLHKVGIFHVHQHLFPGRLWFSRTDLREQTKFVPDFFKVRPEMPHGALVLSPTSAAGRVWIGPNQVKPVSEFDVIGPSVSVSHPASDVGMDVFV